MASKELVLIQANPGYIAAREATLSGKEFQKQQLRYRRDRRLISSFEATNVVFGFFCNAVIIMSYIWRMI